MGSNHAMTISVSEDTAWTQPMDLLNSGTFIKLDVTIDEFVGQQEIVIKSTADIVYLAKKIENERSKAVTKMNDNCSRTHCFIDIKMYAKKGNNLHINSLKIVDLAGSERFSKSSSDSQQVMEKMQATGTNWGLTILARVIGNITELKKPLRGGE